VVVVFDQSKNIFLPKQQFLKKKGENLSFIFVVKVGAKLLNHFHGRQDTQHNDTEQNATQHNSALNDTQHNNTGNRRSAYWA
jgi:hypothetical protein